MNRWRLRSARLRRPLKWPPHVGRTRHKVCLPLAHMSSGGILLHSRGWGGYVRTPLTREGLYHERTNIPLGAFEFLPGDRNFLVRGSPRALRPIVRLWRCSTTPSQRLASRAPRRLGAEMFESLCCEVIRRRVTRRWHSTRAGRQVLKTRPRIRRFWALLMPFKSAAQRSAFP